MTYILNGKVHHGSPPPHACAFLWVWLQRLSAALLSRPLTTALCTLLLGMLLSQAANSWAVSALLVPTLAHSRPLDTASDAAIARDVLFAHTFSRAKAQVARAATWRAFFFTWLTRADALGMRGRGLMEATQQQARERKKHREWVLYGEDIGDDWDTSKHGYTRCAQASFAVQTFFCGSGPSTALHTPRVSDLLYQSGVAALAETVRLATARRASLIVEVALDDSADETFGHHFALRVAEDGAIKLYMSFIREYTLGQYLTRHPVPLDRSQWEAFLQRLLTLEAASNSWGSQGVEAYLALFDVHLGAKTKAGDITFYHAPVCIVPPFNGTRADPTAAGHADNVRQLLPKALQHFSLYGVRQESVYKYEF